MTAYRFENRGRSLRNWGLLAFGVAFGGVAAWHGADAIFFVPVALFVGFPLWTILTRRDCALEVGQFGVRWTVGRAVTEIAREEIAALRFDDWSEGTDLHVDLVSGETRKIHVACVPSRRDALRRALDRLDIPLIER